MSYIIKLTYRTKDKNQKISDFKDNFDFQDELNFREYETKSFSNLVSTVEKLIPQETILIPGSIGFSKSVDSGSGHLVEKFNPNTSTYNAPPVAQAPQR